MKAKPISEQHQKFIQEVVSGLTYKEAFKVSLGKKQVSNGYAEKKGSELASKYALEINEAKQGRAKLIEAVRNTEVAKNALKSLLSESEVDEKLCKHIISPDDVVSLKAIDLYYKRFGSNAPAKVAQTDVAGNDIALSIEL